MTGLPPNRPLNANDTDIDGYTAPPEGPFENVDYYQAVMSDYFETMGIPIVQGRSFEPADAASSGRVAIVNETLVNTFWKGKNPIGQRLRPCCGDQIPWFTVVGVAKDVKQGGIDQKTGTEFYQFVDQLANQGPGGPETMNVVLRTTLAPSALGTDDRAGCPRSGPQRSDGEAPGHGRRLRRIDPASAAAGAVDWRVCRTGAPARGRRHVWRAVVHGGRAPPRDRHSPRAWRRPLARAWGRS